MKRKGVFIMFCTKEKYLIRSCADGDAPTYTCPNVHEVHRPGECGSYELATILGNEPAQPFDGDPNDSRNFHYVHITYLPEGACVGEHYHRDNEQFYLVIGGKAEIPCAAISLKQSPTPSP